MKKALIISFALFAGLVSINAQDCTGYHQFHCDYADYTFFYSRQSTSALFKRGQTNEISMVAYGGEEYYVSVCAHRKFGDIQFKIYEDNAAKTLIYDNATDNYSKSITFENNRSRNLIIEVTVPPDNKSNDRRCVGVIIQFKKIGKGD